MADPGAGTPPAVTGVRFTGGSRTELVWDAATFADRYDVSRGALASLDGSDYGACQTDRDPDPTDTRFDDPDLPVAGAGFFYLVRGVDTTCPAAGTWGDDSAGSERTNTNPAACG